MALLDGYPEVTNVAFSNEGVGVRADVFTRLDIDTADPKERERVAAIVGAIEVALRTTPSLTRVIWHHQP